MNEEAQKALASMVQRALDGVDAAVEFSQAQIPDVVQELLMWHAIKSGIGFSIGMAIIAAGVATIPMVNKLLKRMEIKLEQKKAQARDDYDKREPWTLFGKYGDTTSIEYDNLMRKTFEGGELRGASLVVSACAVVIGLIIASCNLGWLQILIAPKLYLFEYGASLVK